MSECPSVRVLEGGGVGDGEMRKILFLRSFFLPSFLIIYSYFFFLSAFN